MKASRFRALNDLRHLRDVNKGGTTGILVLFVTNMPFFCTKFYEAID